MEWLWTWKGKSFGYRNGDELRTRDGRHVGRFIDDEIYAPDGRYLGEVIDGRLITHESKKSRRKASFTPKSTLIGQVGRIGYVGNVMLAGYEEFPSADEL
ncbi:MAG: hypothetical protein WC769_09455 [Thermodesulfovibrionales bacterium]|jgi:hypothetical protein